MVAQVISFVASKGGVGKTTLATNIALALTSNGQQPTGRRIPLSKSKRVLVIDVDYQRSAGDSLVVRGVPSGTTYARAFFDPDADLEAAIHQVPFLIPCGRLDVMPANIHDYNRAVEVVPSLANHGLNAFSDLIAALEDDYDYIVLDLRPELSPMTSSAMAASNGGVIIPVNSEMSTVVNLKDVFDHFRGMEHDLGRPVQFLGVARTRWNPKSEEAGLVNDTLAELGAPTFKTVIPNHRQISKSFGLDTGPVVTSYPKASSVPRFYQLASEIVSALKKEES
jgi:chromosome partitioning protein